MATDRVRIGLSPEGRPLEVVCAGQNYSGLRVFVIAGQHGDEPHARRAARRLLAQSDGSPDSLAILVNANPDGSALRQRRNAQGIDLNRDHRRLLAPETQAIHQFLRAWKPDLVLDLHTFPSRRRHLLDLGLELPWDVAAAAPTHPAAAFPADLASGLMTLLEASSPGYNFSPYLLLQPGGRARLSTSSWKDARNGITLRHDVFTVLLEGRSPRRADSPERRARLLDALAWGASEVINWARRCRPSQRQQALPATMPFSGKRKWERSPKVIQLRSVETGDAAPYTLRAWSAEVDPKGWRDLPASVLVPHSHPKLLATLVRHRFLGVPEPDGWRFPMNQPGARALALLCRRLLPPSQQAGRFGESR